MAGVNRGPSNIVLEREDDGHRTYTVDWVLENMTGGPVDVLLSGLIPAPGTSYSITGDTSDPWAFATFGLSLKLKDHKDGDNHGVWEVTQRYTTKPVKRCNDTSVVDPLLEPQKISGGFTRYVEEATVDRFGQPILNSAYELIRGQVVEFDANRPSVVIEQNVGALGLSLFAPMIDTVNDAPLWGVGARQVKLSNVSWERKYYGTCYPYFTRRLEFEVRYISGSNYGFDREIADEGTKALNGSWTAAGGGWKVDPISSIALTCSTTSGSDVVLTSGSTARVGVGMEVSGAGIDAGTVVAAVYGSGFTLSANATATSASVTLTFTTPADATNPSHFVRVKDRNGENCRVILDGHGVPWDPGGYTTGTGDDLPGRIYVEKYSESNFLLLGIPTVLG